MNQMGDVSRLAWNFFLFRTGQEQLPPPVYEDEKDATS